MTTKLDRFRAVRGMTDEEFKILEMVYEGGKHGIFEKIETCGKYVIAAFLAYISYDYFSCADQILGWSTAVTSFLMFFGKFLSDTIASTIYSIDIVRNKKYDDAMQVTDLANELRRKQVEARIDALKEQENANNNETDEQPK